MLVPVGWGAIPPLVQALIDWVDGYPFQTGTYKDFWGWLRVENRGFFERLDSSATSDVNSDAMARAEDDGLMRRPLFVPPSAQIRRCPTRDPVE